MVTECQLFGGFNSLYYRRKLYNGIPELEEIIHHYLEENEIDYLNINGYQVMRNNGRIIIQELLPYNCHSTDQSRPIETKSRAKIYGATI